MLIIIDSLNSRPKRLWTKVHFIKLVVSTKERSSSHYTRATTTGTGLCPPKRRTLKNENKIKQQPRLNALRKLQAPKMDSPEQTSSFYVRVSQLCNEASVYNNDKVFSHPACSPWLEPFWRQSQLNRYLPNDQNHHGRERNRGRDRGR